LWQSLGLAGLLLALAQLAFLYLSLSPLRRVAGDVARIERGEQESLGEDYPLELQPLSRNLERLLRTEKSNRERYRSALDSLAHSLKTPLAVLRARLEAGGEENLDPVARDAVEDMHRLIATRLQRAASTTRRTLAAPTPVAPVAERLAKALRRIHSHGLRSIDVILEPGLRFYGEERDLLELLGNLLENACKYGAGQVRLAGGVLEPQAARPGVWFTVDNDAAPGVRGEQLQSYLPRGVRGDERERVEGQGLGLAIVSEIVKAYGGSITFGPINPAAEAAERGVRVAVRLPPT
jgi:two-component system sensor histidine kinase PhoQ